MEKPRAVLVIGLSGKGKSPIINAYTGSTIATVGHGDNSFTTQVQACSLPQGALIEYGFKDALAKFDNQDLIGETTISFCVSLGIFHFRRRSEFSLKSLRCCKEGGGKTDPLLVSQHCKNHGDSGTPVYSSTVPPHPQTVANYHDGQVFQPACE